jgi:hypothetical protein
LKNPQNLLTKSVIPFLDLPFFPRGVVEDWETTASGEKGYKCVESAVNTAPLLDPHSLYRVVSIFSLN